MRLILDRPADALYLRLDESRIVESEEVQSGIVLDYESAGRVVGIEILGLADRVDEAQIRAFQFESVS